MKTSKHILITIVLMALSHLLYSQTNSRTITLTCNTAIINSSNFNNHSVCNFGQPSSISNEDYLEQVQRGTAITWEGMSSSDPNDEVNILWIKKDGRNNFFNKRKIRGDGQPNEKVRATVSKGDEGQEMKYAIKFKVKRGGSTVGNFVIDPKLQI